MLSKLYRDKRNKYLEIAGGTSIEFLLVIDSDEFAVIDNAEFSHHLDKIRKFKRYNDNHEGDNHEGATFVLNLPYLREVNNLLGCKSMGSPAIRLYVAVTIT